MVICKKKKKTPQNPHSISECILSSINNGYHNKNILFSNDENQLLANSFITTCEIRTNNYFHAVFPPKESTHFSLRNSDDVRLRMWWAGRN